MTARILAGPGDADERVVRRWGGRALGLLARHAPDAASLASAVAPAGLDPAAVAAAHGALLHRLRSAPASEVWFDLSDGLVDGLADGLAGGPVAAGVAAARLAGLGVRGEAAPVAVGVRLAGLGRGGDDGDGRDAAGAALADAVAALVATARRGADAPEVELGSLPERLLVVVPAAGAAPGGLSALERSHGLPAGWLEVRVEPGSPSAPVLSGAQEADAAAVRAVWAEHARLALGARAAGVEPGVERHPAHLVARHLTDLLLAAG